MSSQGYVDCLKYSIGEAVQYYRFSKQKSYTGLMHRINMGCEIYPRERNFWDWEAFKTITVIDKYIFEMALYDAIEARSLEARVKQILADIDLQCDAYKWYENKCSIMDSEQEEEKEYVWKAEDFAIGVESLQ